MGRIASMHVIDPERDDLDEKREKASEAYLLLQELVRQPELIEFNEFGKVPKQTKGYLDGCFDLCHAGHYNAVRQAA